VGRGRAGHQRFLFPSLGQDLEKEERSGVPAGSQRRQEVKTAPRVLGIERPWMASAGRSLLLTLRNLLLFPGLGLA